MSQTLPIPPAALRRSIGDADFDNPTGAPIYPDLPASTYDRVFDFGCGCGRLARQLMQQRTVQPQQYLGVDLHRLAVEWASEHLGALDPRYRFAHLDAFSRQFNPEGATAQAVLPTDDTFTLVIAHSVFTHILEADVAFYLREVARVLAPGGTFVSTWFLFDKRGYPMMQEFQNALYIQLADPTNAVIYAREFVRDLFRSAGLTITKVTAPWLRGFQWELTAVSGGGFEAEFPDDTAPFGIQRPPLGMSDAR